MFCSVLVRTLICDSSTLTSSAGARRRLLGSSSSEGKYILAYESVGSGFDTMDFGGENSLSKAEYDWYSSSAFNNDDDDDDDDEHHSSGHLMKFNVFVTYTYGIIMAFGVFLRQ